VVLPLNVGILMLAIPTRGPVGESKLNLLQGTLDLMVLQTLAVMGALHGYGIALRIEQISGNEILLNQGTIYASLVRLQQRGWISAEWGASDNNSQSQVLFDYKKRS
jgi:PadR family transcriptional regulator PadR